MDDPYDPAPHRHGFFDSHTAADPLYKTGVTLYINRINYNIVPEVVNDSTDWMGYEAFFQTEYRLLKSKDS